MGMAILQEMLVAFATAAITALCAYGVTLLGRLRTKIEAETSRIKDEAARALLMAAIDDLGNLVETTVAAIEQTAAKSLRRAVADGEVSSDELKALSVQAACEIRTALRDDYIAVLEDNYGDFSRYLENSIEAALLKLKTKAKRIRP